MYGLQDSSRLARDAMYVSIGFGVLGFQKLQVRRRELEKELAKRREEHADPLAVVGSTLRQVADVVHRARP